MKKKNKKKKLQALGLLANVANIRSFNLKTFQFISFGRKPKRCLGINIHF